MTTVRKIAPEIFAGRASGNPYMRALADNALKSLEWAVRWREDIRRYDRIFCRQMMRDSALRYRRTLAILKRALGGRA